MGHVTCYYWIDTPCIPVRHRDEKVRAINSMGRIYAGANCILVLDPALSRISLSALQGTGEAVPDGDGAGHDAEHKEDRGHLRAIMLVDASPWMAHSWPLQEAAIASAIYIRFADHKFRYVGPHLGISSTLETVACEDANGNDLSLIAGSDIDFSSPELITGEVSQYAPNTEFVSVWNQLARRTTSYPDDVPAIFAALLHKSAGELLSIAPHHRTRAIMRCVESLPLDILAVERDGRAGPASSWVPRFPGSQERVPEIDFAHGVLHRTANGFLVQHTSGPSQSTRILVCPSGLGPSGRFLIRDIHSDEAFVVQVTAPATASKCKLSVVPEGSQLLLLLSKPCLRTPAWNVGVLCAIHELTGDILRACIVDSIITWQAEPRPRPSLQRPGHDCFVVDDSYTVFIKIGTLPSFATISAH